MTTAKLILFVYLIILKSPEMGSWTKVKKKTRRPVDVLDKNRCNSLGMPMLDRLTHESDYGFDLTGRIVLEGNVVRLAINLAM
jgi:hypothetical protein